MCVRDVCVPDVASIPATTRSCYRIECEADADCCTDFVPDPGCADYDAACQANPNDCLAFDSFCRCNRACSDARCEDTTPECIVDSHCLYFDRRLCEAKHCVECRAPADCADSTDLCEDGACVPRCTADAECDLLQSCVDGRCTDTGCTTDRECIFLLGSSSAVCDSGECVAGCDSNAECDAAAFETCRAGRCEFVGCENDAECRVYLDIENETANVSAECR